MKNNDKGFTLVEIIISMVIVTILFVGAYTAFVAMQKINYMSDHHAQMDDIGTSFLESLESVSYNDITEEVITLPSSYIYSEPEVTESQPEDTEPQTVVSIDQIKGHSALFDLHAEIQPIKEDVKYNSFSDLKRIIKKGSVIINLAIPGNNGYSDYAQKAIDEYVSRINATEKGATSPIDPMAVAYNMSRTVEVQLYHVNDEDKIVVTLRHSITNTGLVNSYGIDKDYTIPIYNGSVPDLKALYIFRPETKYGGIPYRLTADKFDIVNGNSNNIESTVETDIYVIQTSDEYSDTYSRTNVNFDYRQTAPDYNKVRLFTNLLEVQRKAIKINQKKLAVFEPGKLNDRLYNVNVTIRDISKGTSGYDEITMNKIMLVMDDEEE